MPLVPKLTLQEFNKRVVDFMGPISPAGKHTRAIYIIVVMDYLTRWEEDVPIKDCTATTTMKCLFEKVVTSFECPKILIIDQGTHFVNQLIEELKDEFEIQHRRTTPYHPTSEWSGRSI